MNKFKISIFALIAVISTASTKDSENLLKELPKTLRETFAFVPAKEGQGQFYISKGEISQEEYNLFLDDLRAKGNHDKLRACMYDTAQWEQGYAKNPPYAKHYHAHPAYAKYPVVNISYEAAVEYCKWLSQKYADVEGFEVFFRLPTKEEWLHAANGSLTETNLYAWGNHLQNKEGLMMCNFRRVGVESVSIDPFTGEKSLHSMPVDAMAQAGKLNDNADITAPVYSYWPNAYGLFNMNGNVAEMVGEKGIAMGGSWASGGYDVQNSSELNYKHANPFVGFRTIMTVRPKAS